jgi:hypothetical protein
MEREIHRQVPPEEEEQVEEEEEAEEEMSIFLLLPLPPHSIPSVWIQSWR